MPGLVTVKSNKQMDAEKAQARLLQKGSNPMADFILNCWEEARQAKTEIEARLISNLRQRKGEYDPEKLALIRERGGSEIFMMLTAAKCRTAESWIKDIIAPPGDKPWSIEPLPENTIPGSEKKKIGNIVRSEATRLLNAYGPEAVSPKKLWTRIRQLEKAAVQARRNKRRASASALEARIHEDLTAGGFYEALLNAVSDLCTFPACFIKGPVVRQARSLCSLTKKDGRSSRVSVETVYTRRYERVSPFDIYPSPDAKSVQDGYLIQRHRLSKGALHRLLGVPGFDEDGIRSVLAKPSNFQPTWVESEKDRLLSGNVWTKPRNTMEAIEFWGQVNGKTLLDWGLPPSMAPDPLAEMDITAWLVADEVIMVRLNPDPLGRRPYFSASFESINESIWGVSPPELLKDAQDMVNASARSLVNNMAIASGPQVEVHQDRVDPGEDIEDVYPWKIWKTASDDMGAGGEAIRFYQPNPMVAELMQVYRYFQEQASETSGIPAYIQGGKAEAGRTAKGLSMLFSAASKTLKAVVGHIDEGLVKPVILAHKDHLLATEENFSASHATDVSIVARASDTLLMADQLLTRRQEFLKSTLNPTDLSIIGMEGRAAILREQAKALKIPVEDIVPDKARLRQKAAELAQKKKRKKK